MSEMVEQQVASMLASILAGNRAMKPRQKRLEVVMNPNSRRTKRSSCYGSTRNQIGILEQIKKLSHSAGRRWVLDPFDRQRVQDSGFLPLAISRG
jgi:hypothetical protein